MTPALRILVVLCSLTSAAHFLRFGTLWEAVPVLFLASGAWTTRLVPRPALALAAVCGALMWTGLAVDMVNWRMSFGLPWLRLAAILGGVALAHLAAFFLLMGRAGNRLLGPVGAEDLARTAAGLLTAGVLIMATRKAPFPLLLGERFLPGSAPLWISCFAIYAGLAAGWLLRSPHARSRIWSLFSAVFFGQLALGLVGWGLFLMTGKLHLPVPALILAGPIYRGEGFFMPILLGVSLLLAGPAWCSHLCYIGAWDDRMARLHAGRPQRLPEWAPRLRAALLAAALCAPLALRALSVPWEWALGLAGAFGLGGVAVMATASRRSGTMTHCTVWCPIGLVNNLLGRLLPWRVTIDASCTRCGACSRACLYNALTPADLDRGRPGLTCSLCGDCLPRCPHGHLGYRFPGLTPARARQLFVVLVSALHAVFLAVARI